jgi:hypothetical protein
MGWPDIHCLARDKGGRVDGSHYSFEENFSEHKQKQAIRAVSRQTIGTDGNVLSLAWVPICNCSLSWLLVGGSAPTGALL